MSNIKDEIKQKPLPNNKDIGLLVHHPIKTTRGIQNKMNWTLMSMDRALATELGGLDVFVNNCSTKRAKKPRAIAPSAAKETMGSKNKPNHLNVCQIQSDF